MSGSRALFAAVFAIVFFTEDFFFAVDFFAVRLAIVDWKLEASRGHSSRSLNWNSPVIAPVRLNQARAPLNYLVPQVPEGVSLLTPSGPRR